MSAADQALVASPRAVQATESEAAHWNMLRDVPLRLSVDIALPPMSLRALGALEPGQVLPSSIATADDLLIVIGGSPVCLCRFEYMDGRMAVRGTRLVGNAGAAASPSVHTVPVAPFAGAAA